MMAQTLPSAPACSRANTTTECTCGTTRVLTDVTVIATDLAAGTALPIAAGRPRRTAGAAACGAVDAALWCPGRAAGEARRAAAEPTDVAITLVAGRQTRRPSGSL